MNRRQTIPKALRFTIRRIQQRFPDDAACLDDLMQMRFPGGITYCEKCEQERKHYRITGRPAYACGYCGTQISPMAGTIFEKSTTSSASLVLCHVPDGDHSLRYLGETDSARNRSDLQNRVAHVQADSLVAVRT